MKRRKATDGSGIQIYTLHLQDCLHNRQVTSEDGIMQCRQATPGACVHVDTAWLLQNSLHRRQVAFKGCSTELRFHAFSRVVR